MSPVRSLLEAEIERLIDMLDMIDGDENLEPYLAGFDDSFSDREDEVDSTETSDLELWGESDGLEHGELDYAESDGGGHIEGGGYHL